MLDAPSPVSLPARLLGLFTLSLLAGCGGGGGSSGGGAAPQQVALFDLRRDVTVANSGLTDAVYVDVDADGVGDLVQCDYADETLAVGRGLFDGNFALTQSLVTPGHPWALAVGDYDGDGRLDVAVACRDASGAAGRIALWLGNGDGEFVAAPTLELAEAPLDLTPIASPLAARDRLLVAQLGLARTLVLELGTGAQWTEFAVLDGTELAVPGAPHSVEAHDVDADGVLDVAVAELCGSGGDRVVWRHGSPDGSFGAPQIALAGLARPMLSRLVDADGNGFGELGVAQMDAPFAFVLWPRPEQAPAQSLLALGYGSTSLLLCDLDADGLVEAVASLWREQALATCAGLGAASFDLPRYYNVGTAPRGLARFQSPSDAHPGVLCVNSGDASILRGDGSGALAGARGYPLADAPTQLATVDVDADGRADVISIDAQLGALALLGAQESGGYSAPFLVTVGTGGGSAPAGFRAHDYDGDGDVDVLATLPVDQEVQYLQNSGGLELQPAGTTKRFGVGPDCGAIAAGDLDSDGDVDGLVASASQPQMQWIENVGGEFQALLPQTVGARAVALTLADLDLDGDLDALTIGQQSGEAARLSVHFANDALFAYAGAIDLPALGDEIHAQDLDGDGYVELVVSQGGNGAHGFVVARTGTADVLTSQVVPVGYAPSAVALDDADGDGDVDVWCPLGQGGLRVALNDGAGALEALEQAALALPQPVPFGTVGAALSDGDGDGAPDLLMVSPYSSLLWVARRMTAVAHP